MQEPLGFNGYQEIVEWLEHNLGVNSCYKIVHKLVYYRLESCPKVPRPKSVEQQQLPVEAFKKTLHTKRAMLHWFCLTVLCTTKTIRFWCEDETRIGLKTITGRKITSRGVKPVGVQSVAVQSNIFISGL